VPKRAIPHCARGAGITSHVDIEKTQARHERPTKEAPPVGIERG
jgi:hypothetical protein